MRFLKMKNVCSSIGDTFKPTWRSEVIIDKNWRFRSDYRSRIMTSLGNPNICSNPELTHPSGSLGLRWTQLYGQVVLLEYPVHFGLHRRDDELTLSNAC